MKTRPTSITVVGWFLMVTATLGLLSVLLGAVLLHAGNGLSQQQAMNPTAVPILVQYAVTFAASLVDFVCGYFLMRGRNWARYLYVGSSLAVIGFEAATSLILAAAVYSLVITAVITFFLFRPPAGAFFKSGGAGYAAPTTRRTVSILFYVLSGIFFSTSCLMVLVGSHTFWAKLLMLSVGLLPAAVLLSIGRAVSRERRWARDVGVVLAASAAMGALAMAMLPFYVRPAGGSGGVDYVTGIGWAALLGVVGWTAIVVGRRQPESG